MKNLKIIQNYVSIFASGNSLLEMTSEEFAFIKKKSFVITTNYAPIRFSGHMNCWSDKNVSLFLTSHYEQNPKDCLFLSREAAFLPDMKLKGKVDHWFHNQIDKLYGNFTASWVLQLVRKYFPDKTILLFGFDFYNTNQKISKWYDQYSDFDAIKRGKQYDINHKLNLYKYQLEKMPIQKSNIYNCNPESELEVFEKKCWWEILPINILHLCNSPLAGAPLNLSNVINKYSNSTSKAFLKKGFDKNSKYSNLVWDYDKTCPNQTDLTETINNADIIHHHGREYIKIIDGKKEILQYHTPPTNYVPEKTDLKFNGKKLVIAQYHPRFYTDAMIVPNIIDIWDKNYMPESKGDIIRIFYSWASEIKGGWSDKGSEKTISILNKIKNKYGGEVEVIIYNNKPHSLCMEAKRIAHICIDECITGSYHLQSLEGCSVGAVTFNNIDEITLGFLQKVTGAPEHPFEKCNIDQLLERICYYIENRKELEEKGKKSREWMERYWEPGKLVNIFLYHYYNIIKHNNLDQEYNQKPDTSTITGKIEPIKEVIPQVNHIKPPLKQVKKNAESNEKLLNSYFESREFIPECGKSIVSLHNYFKDEKIYIFGTGPSIFKIDKEMYKDKICFSINHAFEVMPYMDYYFTDIYEIYHSIKNVIDINKMVLPFEMMYNNTLKSSFISEAHRVRTKEESAYIYPIQNPMEKNIRAKYLNLDKNTRFFTWSTVTHSAIHIAAYMGAKIIYLIGMDYKDYPNGKPHFTSRYNPLYGLQNWNTFGKHQEGDQWLKQKLFNFGVQVFNLSKSNVLGSKF